MSKTMKPLHCSFFNVPKDMQPYLKKGLKDHTLTVTDQLLVTDKIPLDTEVLGVFVDSKVPNEVFRKLKKLKLITAMSTGYDHIDIVEAKKRKIPVCNVPTYGENTVAEHAMALMLALSRRLFDSVHRVKEHGIFDYHGLRGFDIKGKTVGIVGTGHIGMHLIKMLRGFDATILATDTTANTTIAKENGFSYVPLKTLLATSDIISLHTPLFPDTYHMINKRNIKLIKKGSYIINTARGALIDPEALVWALETGHIAGAGLDVLETEEFQQHPEQFFFSETNDRHTGTTKALTPKMTKASLMNEIIIDHPNTIVTPHNAFNSTEALKRIFDVTVENVASYAMGNTQNNVLNT